MPELSRHKTIAKDVVDFINANWSTKPTDAQVSRADSYDAAVKELKESTGVWVVVIVPRVESEYGSRETDICQTPVFVCLLASVPGKVAADIDAWDLTTEQLADTLRDRALRTLDVGSNTRATQIGTVSVPTVADSDLLHSNELFFSVIEMNYQFSVNVPEVV